MVAYLNSYGQEFSLINIINKIDLYGQRDYSYG